MRLDCDQLDELARCVADELESRGLVAMRTRLVDAAELAAMLGVERSYIYEHAAKLGAVRLGDGPRARLRFDVDDASRRLGSCHAGRESNEADSARIAGTRDRRRRRLGTTVPLLPIRGTRGES